MLAEVIRSGFAESRHRGALVVTGPGGGDLLRVGDVSSPMYPRSANKPIQAAAMLRCGLDLDGRLLALAAASHSGEKYHINGVRDILAAAGLAEDMLQCPPALPFGEEAMRDVLRAGGGPDRLQMNCSGKHAAMLATCVAAGWPVGSYPDPQHPLQVEIRHTLEHLSGENAARTGVDGCGAPLFAVSLTGLARAFSVLVQAEAGSPERRVADAMRAHPAWTSGTGRAECALMEAVPGLLLKAGAEGVQAFALPDGRAGAVKIEDGAARALPALIVAILRWLGADAAGVDRAALDRIASVPVLGGGRVAGQVQPVWPGSGAPPV